MGGGTTFRFGKAVAMERQLWVSTECTLLTPAAAKPSRAACAQRRAGRQEEPARRSVPPTPAEGGSRVDSKPGSAERTSHERPGAARSPGHPPSTAGDLQRLAVDIVDQGEHRKRCRRRLLRGRRAGQAG